MNAKVAVFIGILAFVVGLIIVVSISKFSPTQNNELDSEYTAPVVIPSNAPIQTRTSFLEVEAVAEPFIQLLLKVKNDPEIPAQLEGYLSANALVQLDNEVTPEKMQEFMKYDLIPPEYVILDQFEADESTVIFLVEFPLMLEPYRNIAMVLEDGQWKVDSIEKADVPLPEDTAPPEPSL